MSFERMDENEMSGQAAGGHQTAMRIQHIRDCYAEIDRLKERDKQSETLRKDHAAAIRNLRTNVTALDFVAHQMKMKDPGEYVSRSGQISAESCNRILSALNRTKAFLGMK